MRLSSLRMTTKLMIVAAIPFFALLTLTGYNLLNKWADRSEMAQLSELAVGLADVSRLIHELQRERGASAVYIGSKGGQFRTELPQQRQATDEKRRSAGSFLTAQRAAAKPGAYRTALTTAEDALTDLDNRRRMVDDFTAVTNMSDYFTRTIAALLSVSSEISKASRQSDVTSAMAGYVAFLQGKERAGLERMTGATGVVAGKFDVPTYVRVVGLRAEQEAFSAPSMPPPRRKKSASTSRPCRAAAPRIWRICATPSPLVVSPANCAASTARPGTIPPPCASTC